VGDEHQVRNPESVERGSATEPVAPRPSVELPRPSTRRGDLGHALVQAKLSVGPAGDRYEQEADAVAARVVRSLTARTPDPQLDVEGETAGRVVRSDSVGVPSDTTVQRIGRIRRSATVGLAGGAIDAETESAIQASRGGGRPMPDEARSKMEGAFGADFGGVRVHEGAKAAELNDRIQAKAFTVGNDVYFRDGIPDTSSSSGQELLAHELTHVVQQDAGRVRRRGHAANLPADIFTNLLTISPPRRRVLNHRPSTGLGQFDAEYVPGTGPDGRLVITVKPFFEWVQRVKQDNATKDFIVTAGGWDQAEKDDFIAKFRQQTVAAWSGKYSFHATKTGFEQFRAQVEIRCEPVADIDQSHFHHRIQKETDKNEKMSTGIGREQNSGAARNIGNFANSDRTERPHDSAKTCKGIADHDATRLTYLMDAFGVNPIRFRGDGYKEIAPESKAALDNFVAAAVRSERPGTVPHPLVAWGKRNKREKAGSGNRALARAQVVQAYIQSKAFKSNICDAREYDDIVDEQQAEYDSKNSAASKKYEKDKLDPLKAVQYKREVVLEVSKNFVWTGDEYSILAHEFGHMLGSPDEYFTYGSAGAVDKKAAQLLSTGRAEDAYRATQIQAMTPSGNDSHATAQEAMMDLATAADVDIPEYGPNTSSIMSAGADVLPAHYLPLLEVLGLITSDTLTKDDWAIV